MRWLLLGSFFLTAAITASGQAATGATKSLPDKPGEIFAAAEPFYDFSSPELKPWHLKASYQLYDEKGNPTEQGTYEYWWVSPQVYRRTWSRPGAMHTDWHTADGKHTYKTSGGALNYFEYKLQAALLSPLPGAADLDPAKYRLSREMVKAGGLKIPCLMVIPLMQMQGKIQSIPLGWFPTYCFDVNQPVLIAEYSLGTVAMAFSHIVRIQNRYLAGEIQFSEGKQRILTAKVETVDRISPSDAALIPAADASIVNLEKAYMGAGAVAGMLIHKPFPVYPQDAKDAHIEGTVRLQATIGMDGGVHDLHVLSTPWPSLAASALWTVSHWQYRPYLVNGQPVDVETTIQVIYSLER